MSARRSLGLGFSVGSRLRHILARRELARCRHTEPREPIRMALRGIPMRAYTMQRNLP
jgi:hypothetical protein